LVSRLPERRTSRDSRRRLETQLEIKGELFPNVPLHVERLRAMNMDVALDARRVVAPSYLPVQSLTARVRVENGRAVVRPLGMGFGNGRVDGEFSLDASADLPATRTNLRFDDIDLAAIFSWFPLLRYNKRKAARAHRIDRHWTIAGAGDGHGRR